MGGRGSMGGTRSTYRGTSTADFASRGLNGNGKSLFNDFNSNGGGNGGGGASTKNSDNTSHASTGKVQSSGGGGKGSGGGASTTVPDDKQSLQEQLTEQELQSLFIRSAEYKAFVMRDFKSEAAAERAEQAAYAKWLAGRSAAAPTTASPKPQEGPLDGFRKVNKIAKTPAQIAVDVKTVNPHYNDQYYNLATPSDPRSRSNRRNRNNCQRCVVAGEARAQGYDVMAVNSEEGFEPRVWDETRMEFTIESATTPDGIAELFVKEDGTHPEWEYSTGSNKGAIASDMESKILAWGEGARGFVGVEWEKGGAHIFNVRVIDGKAYYIDYQSGQHGDELGTGQNGWKPYIDPGSPYQGVLRVDNASITENGATWMKERNNLQINAPTFEELDKKLQDMTTQEQDIWTSVWQQVRSGDRITLPKGAPENLAPLTEQEILEITREAWKWVARPD